ncbi:MAG: EamA family transporter, partial [Candidatus Limnocylindrales bacterium]
MDPLVFLLVAAAAVLHVGWNVLLKTAGDPLRAAAVGMGTAALVICPLALGIWLATGRPDVPAWTIALSLVSGALEAIYFAFLAAAYRRGDLSLVYPIARGTAPLLAVAIGVLLLNERLGPIGFLGVGALLAGLLSLQRPWQYIRASGRASGGAAAFALLTGITIAAYSAVDRVAVRGTTPWIYAGLIWASGALLLWGYAWIYRRRRPTEAVGSAAETAAASTFSRQRAAVGGVITLAAYLLILGALSVAPL